MLVTKNVPLFNVMPSVQIITPRAECIKNVTLPGRKNVRPRYGSLFVCNRESERLLHIYKLSSCN